MPSVEPVSNPTEALRTTVPLHSPQNGQQPYLPPDAKDAYREMVKIKFQERPDVYDQFLDIMKDFKDQTLDARGVIERISSLFTDYPVLIQGFNTFLPQGYRTDCFIEDNNQYTVTVTTPTGTQTHVYSGIPSSGLHLTTNDSVSEDTRNAAGQPFNDPVPPSVTPMSSQKRPATFNRAVDYVNKVKLHFASDPDSYKQFLEILRSYQREQRSISSVYEQVAVVFDGSVDLLDEFKQMLPDNSQSNAEEDVVPGASVRSIGREIAVTHRKPSNRRRGRATAPQSALLAQSSSISEAGHGPGAAVASDPTPVVRLGTRNPGYPPGRARAGKLPVITMMDDQATSSTLPSSLLLGIDYPLSGQIHSMPGEDLGAEVLNQDIVFENEIQPFDSRGHFCDLFLGTHPKAGRVALKRLRHRGGGEDEVKALSRHFQRETEIWLGFRHERILKCLGAFTRDGHLFIVSPFMMNGTLYDWLRSGEHIGRERLRLIHELASALVYLHSSGVIHGDVKANNVLLSDDFHVQLCDFGLTKLAGSDTTTTLKGAGSIRWQAPELWGNEPKTVKSDVYAFAMTIVEILTSDIPFAGSIHDTAVLIAVYALDERPAREPDVSPDGTSYANAWDVAERCWPKDVDQRIHMAQATELLLVGNEVEI